MGEFIVDSKDKKQQVKSLMEEGNIHLNDGEYRAAVFCYDEALELNEDDTRIWDNRGVALSRARRYQDAIESFEIALDLEPDNVKAWVNMGVSLGVMGRFNEAINCFNHALEIDGEARRDRDAHVRRRKLQHRVFEEDRIH